MGHEIGWVISAMGSATSLFAVVLMFREIGRHQEHVAADPVLVARLVRSAPQDWLKTMVTKT